MPRELSGGQCQRVAVGRAIIRRVEVFLMDEPLSNLDAKQRVTMRSEITQIHRRVGATTIYVTHDQTEAMTMADRIVVMKLGVVQQIGTPKELYFNPVNKFVAGFIGEPPMNFVDCEAKDKTAKAEGITAKTWNSVKDGKVILGFRPEGAKLTPCDGAEGEGVVELTEMLGDYANVYINAGGNNVIIKVSPYEVPEMGSSIRFYVPMENLYYFDPETENVLEKN
jgi:multiple sugar transport system ATP-binding protein